MKPDPEQLEALLQASIRHPSPAFEAALRDIPTRRSSLLAFPGWRAALKPLAVAASLTLALLLSLDPSSSPEPVLAGSLSPESEWVELFTLAEPLLALEDLADSETRLTLEYYAFMP